MVLNCINLPVTFFLLNKEEHCIILTGEQVSSCHYLRHNSYEQPFLHQTLFFSLSLWLLKLSGRKARHIVCHVTVKLESAKCKKKKNTTSQFWKTYRAIQISDTGDSFRKRLLRENTTP